MSEETSFRSMKITLSEEALRMLEELKKGGSFRSYSMTIEEIIRALYDIVEHVFSMTFRAEGKTPIPKELQLELARDVSVRLARFGVAEFFKK